MHAHASRRFWTVALAVLWILVVSNLVLVVPRMLLNKTGSALSSRSLRLAVLHTTTSRWSNDELVRSFLDAQDDAV